MPLGLQCSWTVLSRSTSRHNSQQRLSGATGRWATVEDQGYCGCRSKHEMLVAPNRTLPWSFLSKQSPGHQECGLGVPLEWV